MALGLGTAVAFLTLDATGFARGIDRAAAQTAKLDKAAQGVGRGFQTAGTMLSGFGRAMTTSVTTPVAAFGVASVKAGMDFDHSMSTVEAVTKNATNDLNEVADAAKLLGINYEQGANDSETAMNAMRAAAIKMGNDTKFTANESAEALYYMGQAGWNAQQAISGLPGVLNLAAVGNTELGSTSDIVTDAVSGFGHSAEETVKIIRGGWNTEIPIATRLADIMANTMANSNTDVEKLGRTFSYVAPIAGTFGYSMEDVAIASGLMANAGIKATRAGTTMRQGFKRLVAPTDDAAKAMEKYGFSAFDADGKTKPLRQQLVELRGIFGNLDIEVKNADGTLKTSEQIMEEYGKRLPINDQEKLNDAVDVFGTTALPGMLALMVQSDEAFNTLAKQIDNASAAFVLHNGKVYAYNEAIKEFGKTAVETGDDFKILGASEGMALIQMDNLKGDITLLTSALGTTKIIISDMVKGPLREFVQKLTDLVRKFNELNPETQKHIAKVVALVAAIGPALMIIGRLTSAFGRLMSAMKVAGGLFKLFGSISLGPALAIVGGIAGAGYLMYKNWSKVAPVFKELWDTIKDVGISIYQTFKDVLAQSGITVDSLSRLFVNLVKKIVGEVKKIIKAVGPIINKIIQLIGKLLPVIKRVFYKILNIVGKVWDKLMKLFEKLQPVIDKIFDVLDDLMPIISDIIGLVFDFIDACEPLLDMVIEIIGTIADMLVPVIETVKNILITLWPTIKTIAESIIYVTNVIFEGLKPVIDAICNVLKNILPPILNVIMSIIKTITPIIETIIDVVTKVANVVGDVLSVAFKVVGEIIEWLSPILEGICEVFEGIAEIVGDILTPVFEVFKVVIDAVGAVFEALWDIIKSIIGIFFDLDDAEGEAEDGAGDLKGGMKELKKAFKGVADFINNILGPAFDVLKGVMGVAIDTVGLVASEFKGAVSVVSDVLKGDWEAAHKDAEDAVLDWGDKTASVLNTVTEGLFGFSATTDEWAQGFEEFFSDVGDFFENWGDNIMTVLKDVGDFFGDVWDGICDGVSSAASWVADKATAIGANLAGIPSDVKEKLGIHSPSREFIYIGKMMGEGLVVGWETEVPSILKIVNKTASDLVSSFVKTYKKKKNKLQESIKDIKTALDKARKEGKEKQAKHLESKLKKQKEKLKQLKDNYIKTAEDTLSYYKKYHDVSLTYEIKYWEKILKKCKKGTKQYKEAAENLKEVRYDLQKSLNELDKDYNESVKDVAENLIKSIKEVEAAYEEAVSKRAEQIADSMSLFDEFTSTTENTAEGLIGNLKSQVDGLREWDEALDTLAQKNIPKELQEQLAEMGPSALADVKLLVGMTEEQLNEYVRLWKEKNALAMDRASDEVDKQEYIDKIQEIITTSNEKLEELAKTYNENLEELGSKVRVKALEIGNDLLNGITFGMKDATNGTKTAFMDVFNGISSITLNNKDSITAYTDTTAKTVKSWGTNVVNIVEDTGEKVTGTAKSFMGDLKKTFDTKLNEILDLFKSWKKNMKSVGKQVGDEFISGFKKSIKSGIKDIGIYVGKNIVSGIISGIKANEEALRTTISNVINVVEQTAEDTAEIGSPSRLFARKVGKWIPLGIAEGIAQSVPQTIAQSKKSMNTAIDATLDAAQKELNNADLEVSPIDLSDIVTVTDVAGQLKGAFDDVSGWFKGITEDVAEMTQDMVDGIQEVLDISDKMVYNIDDGKETFGNVLVNSMTTANAQSPNTSANASPGFTEDNSVTEQTFIFNSPKAIDEVEASRLLRQTARDLAEGFA